MGWRREALWRGEGVRRGVGIRRGLIALPLLMLAAVLPLLLPRPAAAQGVTFTTSTTTHDTLTRVDLPGQVVVAGSGPAASYLTQVLAGPNGVAVRNALAGISALSVGPVVQVGQVATGTSTSVTVTAALGPGTILIGPNQSVPFFVAAGTTNFNTNTHTENFFNLLFQSSQSLTASGVSYLTGDLYTGFQTTMIDGAFSFMSTLLARGTENGAANGTSAQTAFVPDATGSVGDAHVLATSPAAQASADVGNGWRAWLRAGYGRTSVNGTDANFGFSSHTTSLEGGVERVDGSWLYGIALGFGQAQVSQYLSGDHGGIDTFRVGGYGGYRDGPWSLTGAVAAGFSSISAIRLSLLPTAATSAYSATTLSAGIEGVRRFDVGDVRIEPLAGLVYTTLRVNDFSESGTTFLDLAGSGARIDALKGYVGGRVSTTFTVSDITVTPELRGRVLYDFLDDTRGFTARFITDPAATPIAVSGVQPGRLSGMIGVALAARFSPHWQAFASYDAELRRNSVTHLASAGLKVRW